MARTVSVIQSSIQDSLVTNMASIGVTVDPTQWSKRNIMRMWCFVVATAIAFFEQLLDNYKASVEATAAKAIPGTPAWVQAQVLNFQYDATTPQVIQLINLQPVYPIVDATKRIVTRCSVKTDLSNNVKVKVAKQTPPVALSGSEISALQSYLGIIGYAGINYLVVSQNADQLYIAANIYYKGQYSSVISANVQAAINAYLSALQFDGAIKVSDIENTIRNVTGVNDVVLSQVRIRQDTDLFAAGYDLVALQQTIARTWNLIAGYVISETTSGKTLTDSLVFIAE